MYLDFDLVITPSFASCPLYIKHGAKFDLQDIM